MLRMLRPSAIEALAASEIAQSASPWHEKIAAPAHPHKILHPRQMQRTAG